MFSLEPLDFSFSRWLQKAVFMLKMQFIPNTWSLADLRGLSYFLFFLPFNILSLLMFVSLKPRTWKENWALGGIVFFLLHLMTIAVFNNQARYMGPIMPVIVAASSIAFFRERNGSAGLRRVSIALIAILAISSLFINISMARYSRAEGAMESAKRERIQEHFNSLIPPSDNVMSGRNPVILTGYLLRPRLVLFVNEARHTPYTKEQYLRLARKVDTKWLVCFNDSSLPVILEDYVEKEADISDGLAVYRFVKKP